MTNRSRILLVLAALALLAVYVLPLWHITLDAPQYPEGLGMYIRINTIEGQNEGNLKSINGLNHYIGMKPIVPESIPELKILPWVFAGLIAFGLGAAAAGRRWLLYAWVAVFALIMVCSLVDFYLWGYDYGHNLDEEHAIIKVPGMSYQPPVIGTKKMLNITASSWPALGGLIAGLSFATGTALMIFEIRRSRGKGRMIERRKNNGSVTIPSKRQDAERAILQPLSSIIAAALLLSGCTPGPERIHYGRDACAHCRMTLSDERYSTQLVTSKGKVFIFDSIECLVAYMSEHADVDMHSLWVTDFEAPGMFLRAEEAVFVNSPTLNSPMGQNLAAFAHLTPEEAQATFEAAPMTWEDVQRLIQNTASTHAEAGFTPPL